MKNIYIMWMIDYNFQSNKKIKKSLKFYKKKKPFNRSSEVDPTLVQFNKRNNKLYNYVIKI